VIVKGECIRCGRKVHALIEVREAVTRAMNTTSRAAELEILRVLHRDLGCHLELCERAPRQSDLPAPRGWDAA
jgi:hypothetical protein